MIVIIMKMILMTMMTMTLLTISWWEEARTWDSGQQQLLDLVREELEKAY